MFPNPNYHDAGRPTACAWAIRHLPFYGRWYRFLLFWPACDGGLIAMRVDPDYPHQDRAVSEVNDAAREIFTQWIADQVGDDAELLAKVVPDYVCLGKRTLQDNGSWLGALTRDDVDLVTDPIAEIAPDGRRAPPTAPSTRSTSSSTPPASTPTATCGRWTSSAATACVLAEQWGDEPDGLPRHHRAQLPQPVLPLRPGHQPGPRRQPHLPLRVPGALRRWAAWPRSLGDGPRRRSRSARTSHDDYNERLQAELDTHGLDATRRIRHSWYRSADGRIYILSPWRLVDYWGWTRQPDLADFVLTG